MIMFSLKLKIHSSNFVTVTYKDHQIQIIYFFQESDVNMEALRTTNQHGK